MIFVQNKFILAELPPLIKRISNMYVYSDIVVLSPISNSQVPIISFHPIRINFLKTSHGVFNPPLNIKVKIKNINSITIKICI